MHIPNPDFAQTTTDATRPQPEIVLTGVSVYCVPRSKKKGYKAWYPHLPSIKGKGKTPHAAMKDLIDKAPSSGI